MSSQTQVSALEVRITLLCGDRHHQELCRIFGAQSFGDVLRELHKIGGISGLTRRSSHEEASLVWQQFDVSADVDFAAVAAEIDDILVTI